MVFVFMGLGILMFFSGGFLKGLGTLVLGVVAFACWAAIHRWALMNPK
jgi:uncharacterized membrane protein YccF (DUF307 family)